MSTALTPEPTALGLASPAIGPWFAPDVTLAAPNADLSVTVALAANSAWLPPAGGLLSLVVAGTPRQREIAPLRQASGAPAFADGAMVAVFQLLSEVEARLTALMSGIAVATATGTSSSVPTRASVRTFALELPSGVKVFSDVKSLLDPPAQTAAEVGLEGTPPTPMRDLKRPGIFSGKQERLIATATDIGTAKLWTFDTRGRAIDPGAVAAWWAFLGATAFTNLYEASFTGADRRTAAVDPQLIVHLVNAHEGTASPVDLARVSATNSDGTNPVLSRSATATAALTIGFTDAPTSPTPDDMPSPEVALLPTGPYGASVALWPSGAVGGITRDFVRVAIVGIEEHLIGQRRTPPTSGDAEQARRAKDQDRPSTQILVGRTTGPALRATTDAAASAVTSVFGGGPTRFVTAVLSVDWTGITPPTLPPASPPETLPPPSTTGPAITVTALVGGGIAIGDTISGQRVLVTMAPASVPAGSWVRAWPLGFDPVEGRHVRLGGGGGMAAADGSVALVIALPDGAVSPPAPMGLDLMIVTAARARLYSDLRFTRPAPVPGSAPTVSAVAGTVIECETARAFATGAAVVGLLPGTTLVTVDAPRALVSRASVALSALSAASLGRVISSGDVVRLVQPAFRGEPEGDAPASLAGIAGVTATRIARNLLNRVPALVAPLPAMEALEIAASRVTATAVTAAVATTPALSSLHELGPSQIANPGAPGDLEVYGTGVALSGPAALSVAEYVRDRTAGNTVNLAVIASTPLPAPAAPAAPSSWAAALRTVGADADAEPGVGSLTYAGIGGTTYSLGRTLSDITTALSGAGITVPAATGAAATSIARALDRRVLSAGWGAREGAVSLAAAFSRAEDFVFIDTPAISPGTIGLDSDTLEVWGALKTRMSERPGLVAIICIPSKTLPGTPEPLARVRDARILAAIDALPDKDRVACFSPSAGPGRSMRLASTTVIVDDAYVLTGTTHLSRRGLTFDSSLAVSVFDDTLIDGRPAEIVTFRRALIAGRLGIPLTLLPDDPVDLLRALRRLITIGGVGRLATPRIVAPTIKPSATDIDIWDHDGSRPALGLSGLSWITSLISATIEGYSNPTP
jgi:hypothetical protein